METIVNWFVNEARTNPWNFASFLFTVVTYIPYLIEIVWNPKMRPTISSWICWLVIDTALLIALIQSGQPFYQMSAFLVGVVLILFVTIYVGKASLHFKDFSNVDRGAISLVLLALALWVYFRDPKIAVILTLTSGLGASIPLAINLWKDPSRESMTAWLLVGAGGICAIFGIKEFTIVGATSQIFFLGVQVVMITLMCRRYLK